MCLPKFQIKTEKQNSLNFHASQTDADDHILSLDGFLIDDRSLTFRVYENDKELYAFDFPVKKIVFSDSRSSIELTQRNIKKLRSPRTYTRKAFSLFDSSTKIVVYYHATKYKEDDTLFGKIVIKSLSVVFFYFFF